MCPHSDRFPLRTLGTVGTCWKMWRHCTAAEQGCQRRGNRAAGCRSSAAGLRGGRSVHAPISATLAPCRATPTPPPRRAGQPCPIGRSNQTPLHEPPTGAHLYSLEFAPGLHGTCSMCPPVAQRGRHPPLRISTLTLCARQSVGTAALGATSGTCTCAAGSAGSQIPPARRHSCRGRGGRPL